MTLKSLINRWRSKIRLMVKLHWVLLMFFAKHNINDSCDRYLFFACAFHKTNKIYNIPNLPFFSNKSNYSHYIPST